MTDDPHTQININREETLTRGGGGGSVMWLCQSCGSVCPWSHYTINFRGFLINSAEIFSRDQLVTTRNSSLSESQVFDEIIIFFFFFLLIPRYDSEVYDEGGNSLQSLDYDTEQVDVRDAPSEEVYTLYYPQEKRWAPPPSLSVAPVSVTTSPSIHVGTCSVRVLFFCLTSSERFCVFVKKTEKEKKKTKIKLNKKIFKNIHII